MTTAAADSEADRTTLQARAARRQREARVRFWRAFAVSSFFVVALGANLYLGAVVVMGSIGRPFEFGKATAPGPTAQIRRPLLDGTFCRNIVFDNATAQSIEDKVERCDGGSGQTVVKTRPQFSWRGQ